MKKIVSLALSTAMAFSMFASVTSAATMSTQEKYDALVAQKIFEGYPDGAANLNKDVTRAEFAKVVALMTGLDVTDTNTVTYSDPNYNTKYAWYRPYTEAVTKAGYMKGTTTGAKKLFNPNGKVTVQEMAATLVRAGKLQVPTEGINNGASAWAKGEVQAAINAGLISSTANFTAAATRSLLVDTAYAYQTKVVKPAVTSYEVQDNGATVVFTLANGEKVTVKPEKALVANTATTVNFKYGEYEYSESVTWKVTDATKVQSVTATNLKQITVTFDGKVDPSSAQNINNYTISGRTFDDAVLSQDGTTVVLTLDEEPNTANATNTLTNNSAVTLNVRNVKQATGTTTITQSVTFTPSDVTAPTVTEVKGLGTKAFQVTFSEPVRQSTLTAANFTVDGKAIAANVQYAYPNKAIVITNLTEGSHTLRVSNVQDFSGQVVAPVEQTFTVTNDTAAPEVVSTSSYDLREVRVTFDEPVQYVGGAYANVSSFTASDIKIQGNTVILKFANPLNYASNSITLTNVRDYSGNSASRTVTVTPTLDLVAPTIVTSEFKTIGTDYVVDIEFSKAVRGGTEAGSALDRSFYTLTDENGKTVTTGGLTSAGHPVSAPTFVGNDNKKVRVNLGAASTLKGSYYTLTVAGVRDTTVAGNVLNATPITLNTNQAASGQISRSWVDGTYVYVEFNKAIATSGAGNALDASKYTYSTVAGDLATATRLTNENGDVTAIGANTVRIFPRLTTTTNVTGKFVNASYVGDVNGVYFTTNATGAPTVSKTISPRQSAVSVVGNVYATGTNKVVVEFATPLSTVRASDFSVKAGTVIREGLSYSLSADAKTMTLTLNGDLPADFASGFLNVAANTTTRDTFGNSVELATDSKIVYNQITPAAVTGDVYTRANGTSIVVTVPVNRELSLTNATATTLQGLFTARVGSDNVAVSSVALSADSKALLVTLTSAATTGQAYLKFDGTANAQINAIVSVNDTAGDKKEALGGFEVTPVVTQP